MATPAQLQAWTAVGAQDAAQRTYASVKAALEQSDAVRAYSPEIFLQGSYANHTNTRGDSDVDIVVMMKSSYMPDTSRLSSLDTANYERARTPGTTTADGLRQAVHEALIQYYGSARVNSRNKCIRVDKRDGYVDADVVPAMQERRFTSYPRYGSPTFIEGISIKPLTGARIVNFPKEHIKNGERKNSLTANNYKPTVRQIKRLRRTAVDAGRVGPKEAPGYLLECLTYNAPQPLFVTDSTQRVIKVLSWLKAHSPEELAAEIKSCDEIHWLFRTDPGGHNQYTAHRVLQVLWDML